MYLCRRQSYTLFLVSGRSISSQQTGRCARQTDTQTDRQNTRPFCSSGTGSEKRSQWELTSPNRRPVERVPLRRRRLLWFYSGINIYPWSTAWHWMEVYGCALIGLSRDGSTEWVSSVVYIKGLSPCTQVHFRIQSQVHTHTHTVQDAITCAHTHAHLKWEHIEPIWLFASPYLFNI